MKISDQDEVFEQGNSYEEVNDIQESPKKVSNSIAENKKVIIVAIGILLLAILFALLYKAFGGEDDKDTASTSSTVQSIVNDTDTEDSDDMEKIIVADSNTEMPAEQAQNVDKNKSANAIVYTEDDKIKLRAAGFTGDDIENMQTTGKNVDDALKEQKEQQTQYLMNLYAELQPTSMDGASDAYKQLLSETWLGQNFRQVQKASNEMFTTKTLRENCRYTKVPPKGGELFIKLILKNGDALFYNVHPEKYEQLDQEGNMVIDYDQVTYGKQIYYLNIKEVPISTSGSNSTSK